MQTSVTRLSADAPDDTHALVTAIDRGLVDPFKIRAILGKTEGNGCVNDFTRGYAVDALTKILAVRMGLSTEEVEQQIVFVMSGGTEGGLSPHWLVLEAGESAGPSAADNRGITKSLAIGTSFTRRFEPWEIGSYEQIEETRRAVHQAMQDAQIDDQADVHLVQIKCPLLTKGRIARSIAKGRPVVAHDTYTSMGYSRGASALGVAIGLNELNERDLPEDIVCKDYSIFSSRASASAGVELEENQVLVMGNSSRWTGKLAIAHSVMKDALDLQALGDVLSALDIPQGLQISDEARSRVKAVIAKAEAARSGEIRGARHIMLDDSDIPASRHARALVGGVLAGALGDTRLFVSGGAEHQGPDGGGPIAVIAAVN